MPPKDGASGLYGDRMGMGGSGNGENKEGKWEEDRAWVRETEEAKSQTNSNEPA